MIAIDGVNYYIDLEEISKFSSINDDKSGQQTVTSEEYGLVEKRKGNSTIQEMMLVGKTVEVNQTNGKAIDSLKYETIRMMLDVLLAPRMGISEDGIPVKNGKSMDEQGIDFKFAFNTLFKYKIIKKL